CLRQPHLLKTQFRALYRAALFGSLSAMIPMIVLPEEIRQVCEIAREAQESLRAENTAFGKIKVGIMIETPSAAILSDQLAPMTDFFSIGTNDLLQYTLAADRENADVAYLTHTLPESVRRLIRTACAAARREGIPVSVCGELGADLTETKFFIESGVTKLSVTPSAILKVRESVMRESSRLIPVRQ
ncbi:MAG: phosphoenolpyruvate--protein phosphotransferase, partial [Clostridia bacterium]|nr:phosphoenolpyruvate--protein phosphotransferase [Clostridia bacterium]